MASDKIRVSPEFTQLIDSMTRELNSLVQNERTEPITRPEVSLIIAKYLNGCGKIEIHFENGHNKRKSIFRGGF